MNILKKNKITKNVLFLVCLIIITIIILPSLTLAWTWADSAINPGNWFADQKGSYIKTEVTNTGYGSNPNSAGNLGSFNGFSGGWSSGGISGSYSGGAPKNFYELVMNTIIKGMLRPIITLIISAAVVVFLYGVFKFIRSDGKEKETGKEFMVWGLVGLFVMMSVWGLVNILRNTFNLNDSSLNVDKVLLH